jgi:type II restriction/modification system DNA methylase subunit YeeA
MNIFNQQNEIAEIVDKILTLKKANPQADTTELEREIDRLVYQLYDLTDEEIAIVEGKDDVSPQTVVA